MNQQIKIKRFPKGLSKVAKQLLVFVMIVLGAFAQSCVSSKANKPPHIVFLISEDPDNYEAHLSIPAFADSLSESKLYKTTVLKSEGQRTASSFPNFELIKDADLVVLFARRLALPAAQMDLLKNYLNNGGNLVGIRTANHGFTLLKGEKPAEGYVEWPAFVPEVLGCENRGYGPATAKTTVQVKEEQLNHELLNGIAVPQWQSDGNLYLVAPLVDQQANLILEGTSDQKTEPIAWTRQYGNSRVFYTSLGYPTDFKNPHFIKLLENAMAWATIKNK
ncbi:ThuA domain-containing protein [Sphingobacterium humi]|uniref:ThuA-like domain-containing protein n=1 Tax=Sphingobacterium humi TaxID=1796905 RepID=A0A6N8KUM2_9SPHI|nr:ThuA domain-containing protein [Sphingobacterium humi]MVZ61173.1 hypothetical protein [Sphingobacterium humi]